jgi:hypothetical protein
MQNKDVIYIDVEDDITAIIGKVKGAKEKIVALVPPKRTGILQSAVNLRLLARTADKANKRLVLITANVGLASLAASAKIPVAKNLTSTPSLAVTPDIDEDDEDVIDGDQLPIGDHAGMKDEEEMIIAPSTIDGIDIEDTPKSKSDLAKAAASRAKNAIKVPDFGSFRKKLAFGIGGGVLLIVFLFWAIAIAPHATVVLSAKTTALSVKTPLTIGDTLSNDPSKATLSSITQTDKVTSSVDFDATGTKDVGDKATGTVVFNNCQSPAPSSLTVDAGTYITAGGLNYVVQATVVVPGGQGNFITGCTSAGQSAPVKVIATDIGDNYNTAAGTSFGVAGFSSKMTASSSAGISGGNKHTAKVVTTEDVQKAQDELTQKNIDSEKKKLQGKFSNGIKVIDTSFNSSVANTKSVPGIGEELTAGKVKLSLDITYTMIGVAKESLDEYLKSAITKQLTSESSQRIYDSGVSTAKFTDFVAAVDKKPATVSLDATGQVGPKIDDDQIKQQVKGKRSGEIIGDLKAIDGIADVDVKLSPFWVGGVPDDVKKITIEFKLINNG